jgi:hypothetical protein
MNANQRIVILNRAALQSVDGWIHIVPKGDLPNAEAGIVQVLDDTSLDSILDGITKDKNRLGDKWPGIYAGREHFIYDSGQDSAALAWFKDFEKRKDGIWAKDEGLTDIGQTAVKNRHYKFTSFVADPRDLKKVEGNKYRVMKIETVGFTNQANGKELLTPIVNRKDFSGAEAPGDSNQPTNQGKKMKSVCTLLGLSPDAAEEAVLAEVTKLKNRGDITPDAVVTLKNRKTELENENQTLLGEQCEVILDSCGVKPDDKRRPHLVSSLKLLKNRAERVAHLADFGIKPSEAKKPGEQTRILNRGDGAAAAQNAGTDEEAAKQAEQKRATKIMNRANELQKQTPSLSLATAVTMASKEIE